MSASSSRSAWCRNLAEAAAEATAKKAADEPEEDSAENRFFEALAEIRALKRAANQAGE